MTDINEEKYQFQEGIQQLLQLIHSNSFDYVNDDFLLEVFTNSIDSCDMMNFEGISKSERFKDQKSLQINLRTDKQNKIFSITDTGLGMTKQDLISNLGSIVRSKTRKMLRIIKDCNDTSVISFFGIGIFSIFFVADKITIHSRNPDDDQYIWEPISDKEFIIKKDEANQDLIHGTRIDLHLKDGCEQFLDEKFLTNYVEEHSYRIIYPVYLNDQKEDILGIGRTVPPAPNVDPPIHFTADMELFPETTIGNLKFDKITVPKCLEIDDACLNHLKKRLNEIKEIGTTDIHRLYDIVIKLTGNDDEKFDLYGLLGQSFNEITNLSDKILVRMVELCNFDENGQNIVKLVCLRLTSPIESIRNWYSKSFQYEGQNLDSKVLYIAGLYLKQLYKCFHDDEENQDDENQIRIQEAILDEDFPNTNFLSWAVKKALEDKISLNTENI